MDSPAVGGDRTESPRRLCREPRALHERGFGVPVGRFMRALCHYYGVELHNFSPNSISQAAVFIAVCERYLGIEAHWYLWIHLFRGELFIENVRGQPKRFARVGGLMLHLRPSRRNLYIPNKMKCSGLSPTRCSGRGRRSGTGGYRPQRIKLGSKS